jgi:hypothetical protein
MNEKVYLITEGATDEVILKKLLPAKILTNVQFVIGQGRYSAQSLARSILAARKMPVALVLDADTTQPEAIQEQYDFLHEALGQAAAGTPFGIFLAKPEIEILLLEVPQITHGVSKRELELAKLHPKKFLHLFSGVDKLLKQLDEQSLKIIRSHTLLVELSQFLSSITTTSDTTSKTIKRKTPALRVNRTANGKAS